MLAEMSACAKLDEERSTHLLGAKSRCPSLLFNGGESALKVLMYTYHGMRQWKRWAEHSSSDRLRAETRRLRLVLRVRGLAMVMVIETAMAEMTGEMATKAAQ